MKVSQNTNVPIPRWRRQSRQRRGAIVVLIAVCLPMFIMMAAFAINVTYMELVRTELRTSTDAAARAAGRTLSLTRDSAAAIAVAKDYASRNLVGGMPLQLGDADVEIGTASRASESTRFVYTPGGNQPNSVRVLGRLASDSATGEMLFPFVNAFGESHFGSTHVALATETDRDIALVLDRSGSMAFAIDEVYSSTVPPSSAPEDWQWGDAVPPNSRWLNVTSAVTAFLGKLDETPMLELVSLVTFTGNGVTDQELTGNYSLISSAIDQYSQSFPGGSTGIGAGMDEGIKALAERGYNRTWVAKTLVLMTDGIHNSEIDPAEIIPRAQGYGVTIHTITFSDNADQALMQQIATACNGKHWHAPTGDVLIQAFRDIADNAPTLITH